MKKLLLLLISILPLTLLAQTGQVTTYKNATTGVAYTQTAANVKDTIPYVRLDGIANGMSLIYNSTTKKYHVAFIGKANVDTSSTGLRTASNSLTLAQTQTALNLKANLASPTFTGTVSGITKTMVGLGNVDNTSDASKPVSTATQTALNLKEDLTNKATGFGTVNNTLYPTVQAVKTYADGLVVGLLDDRGSYDPTVTSAYPVSGGSGTAGAVMKGDLWYISANGSIGGTTVLNGYSVRALADGPGQTASNWNIMQVGLGYIPENVVNKVTDLTSPDNTKYPSSLAVSTGLATKVTSVTGTANQITVTGTTTPVISLPATITGLTSVTSTGFTGALTGNASTATNVAYSGLTGTVPTWNQNTTGNAATATLAANSTLWGGVAYGGPYLPLTAGSGNPLSGELFANAGIRMNTSQSLGFTGQVGYNSGVGTFIWAKAGSSYDYLLLNGAGNEVQAVPTGTVNTIFRGTATFGNNVSVDPISGNANLIIDRPSTSDNAVTIYSTANTQRWLTGMRAGFNTYDIYNVLTESNALSFDLGTNNALFTGIITGTSQVLNSSLGLTDAQSVISTNQANGSNYFYQTFRNLATGYGTWGWLKSGNNDLALQYGTNTNQPGSGYNVLFQYGGNTIFGGKISNDFSTTGINSVNFQNSHGSGFGAYLRGGNGANYSLQVADYNGNNLFTVLGNGSPIFSYLGGTGTRMVVADNTGALSTEVIPSGGGGGGTVVSVGVVSANGLAGTSSGGANPALTLSTTVSGILYGNGTGMSAAVAGNFPTLNQNTTGNAATATNVAWTGVTSRPTALSQFTNDLGNYGGWITSSALTGYAPLNSPAFFGTPTAPTIAPTDNSNSIATTSFAHSLISGLATVATTGAYADLSGKPTTGTGGTIVLEGDGVTSTWDTGLLEDSNVTAPTILVMSPASPDARIPFSLASVDHGGGTFYWHITFDYPPASGTLNVHLNYYLQ